MAASSIWPDSVKSAETPLQNMGKPGSSPPSTRISVVGSVEANGAQSALNASKKAVEISARTGKPKRRKALRACGNCQRTHLTCDDNRPCERCIKRGCAETCADGTRKKMKYLDKSASTAQAAIGSTFAHGAPSGVPAYPQETQFSPLQVMHRNSVSFGNGTASQNFQDVSVHAPPAHAPPSHAQRQAQAPHTHTHSQQHENPRQHLHSTHGHPSLSTAGEHVPPHVDALIVSPGDVLGQHNVFVGQVDDGGVGAPPLHFLPDSSLVGGHGPPNAMPVASGPSASLSVVSPDQSKGVAYGNQATAARIAPKPEQSAFHSSAADSEYTVVARMLEDSRNKGDDDLSSTESPGFASSNVDLRNFVTLHAPPTEVPSPGDPAFSWLDPPPPPPPAVVVQQRKSGTKNVKLDSGSSDQSTSTPLPHPSDIYRNVREPYPYTPAFHTLLTFLKQRFAREQLMRIVRSMARVRPAFIACTKDLTHDDLVFMEQCFQRSLLEYEKYFAYSGTPSIVWRRTGQIAAVAAEFCMLTQWPRHELRSRFIVELMSDESAVDYFERFSEMTFEDSRGEIMYECFLVTPMGQQIRTSAVLTVRKDLFGIPMTIIGNFLPHV